LAVKIRLTRMGRKKKPFYRIVVMDTRAKRDGKYIERLGIYNPMVNPPDIRIDEERVGYWIDTGALISDTVNSLLKKKGIIHKRYLKKKGLSEGEIDEEMKKWEVLQIERERRLAKEAELKGKQKKVEEPEEAKAEETGAEEVKKEEAEVEEAKAEEVKKEEVKKEETKVEETSKEEPVPSAEEVKETVDAAEEKPPENKTVEPEQDTVDQQQELDKQQEQN